jgi:hypothetical protein
MRHDGSGSLFPKRLFRPAQAPLRRIKRAAKNAGDANARGAGAADAGQEASMLQERIGPGSRTRMIMGGVVLGSIAVALIAVIVGNASG